MEIINTVIFVNLSIRFLIVTILLYMGN